MTGNGLKKLRVALQEREEKTFLKHLTILIIQFPDLDSSDQMGNILLKIFFDPKFGC